MSLKKCYGNWLPDIYPCDKCKSLNKCRAKALSIAEYADRDKTRIKFSRNP